MDISSNRESRLEEFKANPKRAVWTLALPMMVGLAIQTAYMVIDMIFVGRVGEVALAAVQFAGPLMFFGLGIVFGLGTGITAVIANFIGAEDKRGADNSAEHGVALGLILGFVVTVAGFIWGKDLLLLAGASDNTIGPAWDYFSIIIVGYMFMVLSVFFRSILTGEGNVRTPVMIQILGTVLNIILDPIFMFGLNMGVKGAAVATVVSQTVVCFIFIFMLFVRDNAYVTFAMKDFSFSSTILRKIFIIGIPASFSMVLMSSGNFVFNRIISGMFTNIPEMGDLAVAAYGIGSRVDHIFLMPSIAIATGLVTVVGMFHGAQRMDLVRQVIYYGMSRAALIGVILGAIFYLYANTIISVFTSDMAVISFGVGYVHILVFAYPFIAISMASGRILQGLGFGMPMLVITFLRVFLISVLLAIIFIYWWSKPLEWIWVAMLISMICSAAVASIWLRWGLSRVEKHVHKVAPSPA
ncbi:MAG: MATE family efflux transporter [Fidelibacterota bacterium]